MADYAAIYWESGSLDAAWLRDRPGVEGVEVSGVPQPVKYRVRFMDRGLTLNVMPQQEVASHVAGFEAYVRKLYGHSSNQNATDVVERLRRVRVVLGCVVEPSFDEEGYVGGLLTSISSEMDGLIFARDSVFDSTGEPLIGPLAESGT